MSQTLSADEVVLGPEKSWYLNLGELWQYRELLFFLTWRDVKVRYKQTVLGVLWAVIQPVMMMVVFTIVFGRMAKVPTGDIPYPIFVYAGLLPWTFFSNAISSCANSVVKSERLITKVYFPRIAIPIASIGAALVDFAIAFSVLGVLMWWYGVSPSVGLVLLPVLVLITLLAAIGVGLILAALNVAYRDFRYIVPFLIQLWLFATPTVYMDTAAADQQADATSAGEVSDAPSHAIPEVIRIGMELNPMTGVIATFRAIVLDQEIPVRSLLISLASIILILAVGLLYFRRVEESFADIV